MNLAWIVAMRGVIAFITLLIFANILGKQQVGRLTFFDFITGITIGDLAATLTVDFNSRGWPHFVGLVVWTALALAAQFLALKSRWWAKVSGGEPAVVVQNGRILEENLARTRYRFDDLLTELRVKDVFDISEVEVALVETNGSLSVQKRTQYQPVTPHDLNLPTTYKGLATELIYDGKLVRPNLQAVHLDETWLETELRKQGLRSVREVALALLGTDGKLFVDRYRDGIAATKVDDEPQHGGG